MSIKQRKATYKDVNKLNKTIKKATGDPYWIRYTKIPGRKWFISVFVFLVRFQAELTARMDLPCSSAKATTPQRRILVSLSPGIVPNLTG